MLISQFYANQDVLITGGTGFIGKAVIEKLLRSCPEVGNVFVLIRGKKGKNANERLADVLKGKLFDRLRREQPQTFSKVYAINGDCSELGLGISKEDLTYLKNVSIIIHSAASVRFDDPLKKAVLLNTRGTNELLKIALTLKQLKVFVHISTTFCNPDKHVVEEKLYPAYADWRTTIKIAETYDMDILNTLNKKYGSNQPNTYTFTKSLSEQVINDYKDKLPVLIFRPSIVVSSVDEPVPGWIDNFNGPMGMLMGCSAGIMRTNYGEPDVVSDYMPIDVLTRGLLIAAFKKGMETEKGLKKSSDELEVYNCCSTGVKFISASQVIELGKCIVQQNPLEKTVWAPGGSITRCRVWHIIRFWTLHIFMAVVVDTLLRLAKQKPMLLRLQRRIYEASEALRYFMVTSWEFKNEKFFALHEELSKPDMRDFGIQNFIDNFDMVKFFETAIQGAKVFLLNEPAECSRAAKTRLEIFKALHYFIQLIGSLLIVRFILRYLVKCFIY